MQSNSFYIKLFRNFAIIANPIYFFYALPLLIIIKIISPIVIVRFDLIISDRIGHMVENYILYKLKKNNNYENSNKLFFDVFFFKKKICNNYFASYLKKNLFIYPRFLIKPIWDLLNILSQKTKIFDSHFAYIKKNKKDGYEYYNPNNKCIMSLSNQDMINGDNFLNSIGIKSLFEYNALFFINDILAEAPFSEE